MATTSTRLPSPGTWTWSRLLLGPRGHQTCLLLNGGQVSFGCVRFRVVPYRHRPCPPSLSPARCCARTRPARFYCSRCQNSFHSPLSPLNLHRLQRPSPLFPCLGLMADKTIKWQYKLHLFPPTRKANAYYNCMTLELQVNIEEENSKEQGADQEEDDQEDKSSLTTSASASLHSSSLFSHPSPAIVWQPLRGRAFLTMMHLTVSRISDNAFSSPLKL